jgi:PIN domain-containing protein
VCAVADTNTVVSAFLWGGAPAAVLEAARAGRITLLTSAALLDELADVLGRDKFASRIRQVGSTVPVMLSNYRALVTLVEPLPVAATSRGAIPTMMPCSPVRSPPAPISSSPATTIYSPSAPSATFAS